MLNLPNISRPKWPFYWLVALLTTALAACQPRTSGPAKGDPAPDFALVDLQGRTHRLNQYRGRVVQLYFFADWCPVCKEEFPKTCDNYTRLAGADFVMLAINVGKEAAKAQQWAEANGATFPVLQGAGGALEKAYGVKALPTNYFVAPDGTVARRLDGWADEQQVRVVVNQALGR
jgi:peroxiredoxin